MPLPINVNRWQNKIRAMMGLRGENPVPTLAELVTVVGVELDRAEWGYAGQETRWISRNISSAAVAGQLSGVGIRNPIDSGVLVIVELVVNTAVSSSQNAQVKLRRGPDPIATFLSDVTVNGIIDTRFYPVDGTTNPPDSAHEVTTAIAGGLPAPAQPLGFFPSGPSTQESARLLVHPFHPVAILAPGSLLLLEGTVANLAMSGWFYGRTRVLERGLPS